MNWLQRIWRWRELDRQLDKELLFHLDEHIAELVANGLDPDEARRQALIELGGPEQVKESCREVRGAAWLRDLFLDLRHALRALRLHPGFTVVAILTLGLGIGITTVMFTIANGVLLKPLQYREPERLVSLHERVGPYEWSLSYPSFQDVTHESRALWPMAAWRNGGGIVSSPGDAEHVAGRQISAGLFALLGVQLPFGREFSAEEDRPGGNPVAIISHALWRSRYKENPSAIGRALVLGGKSYMVVGIAPAGFRLDGDIDVYIPLGQNTSESMHNRDMRISMSVLARLRPGVSPDQARAELKVISRMVAERYPKAYKTLEFTAVPLQHEIVWGVQSKIWLLLGAVVLVLLLSCANLASLLLVRAAAREREMAMRVALGAGRGRLIRQCLTESSVIALLGGVLGVGLAVLGTHPFLAMWPAGLPRAEEIQFDWRVLLFALAISLMSSLLFGLAPALRAPTRILEQALRAGTRTTSGTRRLHGVFVASEVAITIVLLVSAGMLGRALIRFSRLDPGIDARNILTAQVNLASAVNSNPAKVRAAWQEIIEGLRQTQGVDSVGVTDILPMSGGSDNVGYWTNSAPPPPDKMPMALLYAVSPDYLKAMGMTLRQGRFFTEHDLPGVESVAVIDEVLEKRSFREGAIGRYLDFGMVGPVRVVGVVAHVKHRGVAQDDGVNVQGQIYFPFAQIPDKFMREMTAGIYLVVRTSAPPMSLVSAVQHQVRGWANDQAMYNVQTMETIMGGTLALYRFLVLLFGIFAGMALLLAGIGIYGVVSYLADRRMQEFGIRMALGAKSGNVVLLALKQSAWMIVIGVIVGSTTSLVAARALSAAADVPGNEPWTFALMVSLFVVTALVASFVPARRVGRMDPVRVLQQE